jgi:hypothetical protein
MSDQQPGYEALPQPATHRRGRLWGSVAAVVVVAAGAVTSYVAFAGATAGSSSAQQAVQRVITDLEHADLVGLLDDLVPSERAALSSAVTSDITALKRLGVVSPSADPAAVSGVHFAARDLHFGSPITVNDHVQIVQLTGGTIDMSASAAQLPFTQRLLGLAHASGPAAKHVTITKPIRIATQQQDGHWYASLFYTIADHAAHQQLPSKSDYIAATPTGTPTDAVQNFVHAVFYRDFRTAISLISPAELAVVHDYGNLLVSAASKSKQPPVQLQSLDLTSSPISGGVRVNVHDATLTVMGFHVNATIDGGCLKLDAGILSKQICAANAADEISSLLGLLCGKAGGGPCPSGDYTAAQKRAIGDLVGGLLQVGIVVTREGTGWYIAPTRTLADASETLLGALQGDDLFQLAGIGH